MTTHDHDRLPEFLRDMKLENGASEQQIIELEQALQVSLPESYKALLLFTDGAAGRIGRQQLLLYSIEQVLDANLQLGKYAEGLFIFGSDGGGEAYVFDPANQWNIGMAPFIPMGRPELRPVAPTLEEFFESLRSGNHPLHE